ncbi:hypothetical protein E2562_028525 [Oryza meyeriana var. granulata]|uniref:FHA domain-containing protein n=1 Tax=Oryza meyeriana var. granulata TaxID=110450 RepID=A0A6G1DPK6_9ORYZ|nr:hypothetical protein E2562_028525 [Oryza meyeriana var. granulata]
MTSANGNHEAGFAKLQGEDFQYFMKTYSFILGRNTKKEQVDLDISGGDLTVSRHHARGGPIKLDSQDLLQIGQKKFYFLLPTRSIFRSPTYQHGASASAAIQSADKHDHTASAAAQPAHIGTAPPPHIGTPAQPAQTGITVLHPAHIQNNAENENIVGNEAQGEFMNHSKMPFGELGTCSSYRVTIKPTVALGGQPVNKLAIRTEDKNKGNQQEVLLKEEEDILASIGILISDLCGLKKLIPIEKLHSELIARFSATWPQRQVQMHLLTPEAGSSAGAEWKPWLKLMCLLRRRKLREQYNISEGFRHRGCSENLMSDDSR